MRRYHGSDLVVDTRTLVIGPARGLLRVEAELENAWEASRRPLSVAPPHAPILAGPPRSLTAGLSPSIPRALSSSILSPRPRFPDHLRSCAGSLAPFPCIEARMRLRRGLRCRASDRLSG